MRKIGERPLSSIPTPIGVTRRQAKIYTTKRNCKVRCERCGVEMLVTMRYADLCGKLKGARCRPCIDKGRQEVKDAVLAVALRKLAAKRGKL